MSIRYTVLAQAYACNPYQGSEEGVGWGWVMAICRHHNLHVLTAEYHRKDIEAELERHPDLRKYVEFHYVNARSWHYRPTRAWRYIENSTLKPLMNYAYRLWQREAFHLAKSLCRRIDFDLVHVITYVGFRFPGRYWKLQLPLVWGPIGGLDNTPWRYFPALGIKGSILFAGRNFLNTLDKIFRREPRQAFRKADGAVIAATTSIRDEIMRCYRTNSLVHCEIGVSELAEETKIVTRAGNEVLRIVWSGLHIARKALPILLHALQSNDDRLAWQLTVLGDGPLTREWERLARSLSIDEQVTWAGKLTRRDAIDVLSDSHVMVVTSLYDLTSTVIVEAFSVGLPVIAPNHYGFKDAIDENCGIRVAVRSLREIQEGISKAISVIHNDESYRQKLARGARAKARQYRWPETGRFVSRLYKEKVESSLSASSPQSRQFRQDLSK